MADVFISYKKSDADRVRPLVEHLRRCRPRRLVGRGHPAFHLMARRDCATARRRQMRRRGVDHRQRRSRTRRVGDGGGDARPSAQNSRVPVRLDLVAPPLGFGETQYADLAAWSGSPNDPRFQHFLGIVQAIVRSEPIPAAPRPTHFEAPGIKLQGVTMENVNIHVGERRARDDDADEDEPQSAAAPPPPNASRFRSPWR